ncbi:hypothetical protein MBANPS3_012537 [Mucor bainieri]
MSRSSNNQSFSVPAAVGTADIDLYLCHKCELTKVEPFRSMADLVFHFKTVHERFAVIEGEPEGTFNVDKVGSSKTAVPQDATFECHCGYEPKTADRMQQHLEAFSDCRRSIGILNMYIMKNSSSHPRYYS